MMKLGLLLVLLLAGCGSVVVEPYADAGESAIGDAGPARAWGPNQLCLLLPQHDLEGNRCSLNCPFSGVDADVVCDPDRVLFCLWLLRTQGGDCGGVNDTSILNSPDCTEACQ